jgi:hypothetical protein
MKSYGVTMDAGTLHYWRIAASLASMSPRLPFRIRGGSDLRQAPYCYMRLSPKPAVKLDN